MDENAGSRDNPAVAGVNLIVFALAMGGFAIGTTEFAAMSLVPYLAHDLQIDVPTAGHIISAYALGVVVGAPVIAVASARMARRTLLIGLMAMFALGNGLSALAPSYHWMLLFRFLSGLPHGAYFGIAALVAASLVPPGRRTQVIGRVFIGLTTATIVGVPLANILGQTLSWRGSFVFVAGLGGLALTLVALFAPKDIPSPAARPLAELAALRRPQVWLTLAIGAVGFGGLFAVYTYLANTMMAVTHVGGVAIPVVLSLLGIGFTIGNIVVPRFADKALLPTAGALLVWSAAMLAAFPWAAANVWLLAADIFLIGIGGALGTVLQTRLMDVSGDAQALPAALNHSAFNTANALGMAWRPGDRRRLRLDVDGLGRYRPGAAWFDHLEHLVCARSHRELACRAERATSSDCRNDVRPTCRSTDAVSFKSAAPASASCVRYRERSSSLRS